MKPVNLLALLFIAFPAASTASTTCKEQTVSGHHAKMCREDPGMFKHWTFSLEVDGETIFSLIDDYVEQIYLTHTVPEGPALELALSKQGTKTVSISGGCIPVFSDEGAETARKCDFTWGTVRIIENVRFSE
jgi:hypothetical protein